MVSFDYQLKTGEIVEIMTSGSPNYGPNRNWLEIAKTNEAKAKIRSWFKRERRDENIAEGKASLERELRRNNITAVDEAFLKEAAARHRFENLDDFYAAIGYGGIIISKIMPKLKEDYLKLQKPAAAPVDAEETVSRSIAKKQSNGVIVQGIDNCLVRFAKCCNPLPGDEIIGFVTRGYGVSVHKRDCTNVTGQINDPMNGERWINVIWAASPSASYEASLDIIAEDRTALIADITTMLASNHISIREINTHILKNGNANVMLTVEISGMEQLKNLMQKLSKIPGIISVERTGKN